MQTINESHLDQISERLVPLTYFRRNAGEILEKLPKVGSFILTKAGIPVAKLSILKKTIPQKYTEDKIKKLKSLAGGFKWKKSPSPLQIKRLLNKRHEKLLS